ncbi:MAG: hypothetical protein M1819_005479 [Sarea resinae]|nr:MAG: hypothetical protein M1819_005479 [Sarea resinae]
MPSKTATNGKRKAASSSSSPSKKAAKLKNGVVAHKDSKEEEKYGIIQRKFYPPEMTNARCQQYNNDEIPRPIDELNAAIEETKSQREGIQVKDAVVHWFKRDLRTKDNHALHLASAKAKSKGVPLVCLYVVSPQDFEAHFTSACRVDFELRTLAILKEDLAELDIPLWVETVMKRKNIIARIIELCQKWGASHAYCNIEYEVDELRREATLTRTCVEKGIDFTAVHDTCVVPPGELSSQSARQYAVYSPWYRAWVAHIHAHPNYLDLYDDPAKNPGTARKSFKEVFEKAIPDAPPNVSLNDEEKKRYRSLWPAGEHEAHERLQKFLFQKISAYKDMRNLPAANSTAVLSVHFSSGTLSARTAVRRARDGNSTQKLDAGNAGISNWISEVAWRDFYKHVLVHWPFVCMNKPFKPEYTNIDWSYSTTLFDAWTSGRTGFPIVDAAMRQLAHTGYMHNRCRMIVASFLAKDLLLDWRMGETYFMRQLIDGDFASNNGGWGFSASCGVDPQPYFRIFNPVLQSERFDPDGDYIRKWLPELEGVTGKAVHEPFARGAGDVVAKRGYPKPVVVHKEARDKALATYKEGLGRATA